MQDKIAVIGNIPVDHVVRRGKEVGYSPGGAINPAYILKELNGIDNVLLVSNIGHDNYARVYIEPELKKMRDDYVRRIKDAETRLYEVNINDPLRPKITRINEAEKLMDHSYIDISPILPEISTIHFQSCTPIYEGRYRNRNIELIRKASERVPAIPVILDWNKRKVFKSKKAEGEQKEVLDRLDTLKMNEYEAKLFVDPQTKKKPEKIKLRKRDYERLADEIMGSYAVKRVFITLSDRGSYVQTRRDSFRFYALKPQVVIDCTGVGDASSVGYSIKSLKKLNEGEAGAFSMILGSLATENMFSYPHSITRVRMRQVLITKRGHNYCKRHDVDCRGLARKLGLL